MRLGALRRDTELGVAAAAAYVSDWYEWWGVPVTRWSTPLGDGLRVDRGHGELTIVYVSHLDQVPSPAAVRPCRDGDWLRGPGIADMAAGLAAAMVAMVDLADAPAKVIHVITSDEENAPPHSISQWWADFVEAGEETSLRGRDRADMARAGRTAKRMSPIAITVAGKRGHSYARPEGANNAIVNAAHLIVFLDAHMEELRGPEWPGLPGQLERSTVAPTIPAGEQFNVIRTARRSPTTSGSSPRRIPPTSSRG